MGFFSNVDRYELFFLLKDHPLFGSFSAKICALRFFSALSMANLLNKFIMTRILAAITLLLSIVLTILVTIFLFRPDHHCRDCKTIATCASHLAKGFAFFVIFMMYCWCECLAVLLHLNPYLQWEVHGLEGLSKKNWYLLICNHRSWADIVVLCVLFRKHIPMNKYFLKQQLARVPFLGSGVLGAGYAVYEALFPRLFITSSGATW